MAKPMKSIRIRLPNGHLCDVKNIRAWMIGRHAWDTAKLILKIPKIIYETACMCMNKLRVGSIVRRVVMSCSVAAMSASFSFGLVGCSSNQPTDEIEYVVNMNNPKTTEVQKELNNRKCFRKRWEKRKTEAGNKKPVSAKQLEYNILDI